MTYPFDQFVPSSELTPVPFPLEYPTHLVLDLFPTMKKAGVKIVSRKNHNVRLTAFHSDDPIKPPSPFYHEYSKHMGKVHFLPDCHCWEINESGMGRFIQKMIEKYPVLKCYAIIVFQPAKWLNSEDNITHYIALMTPEDGALPESINQMLRMILHDSVERQPMLSRYLSEGYDPLFDPIAREKLTGLQPVAVCDNSPYYNSGVCFHGSKSPLYILKGIVESLQGASEYKLEVLSWEQLCRLDRKLVLGMGNDLIERIRENAKLRNEFFLIGKPRWKPECYEFSFGKREWMPTVETTQQCAARELYEEFRIYIDPDIWSIVENREMYVNFHKYRGRFYRIRVDGLTLSSNGFSARISLNN
jgi:hypothetical protein